MELALGPFKKHNYEINLNEINYEIFLYLDFRTIMERILRINIEPDWISDPFMKSNSGRFVENYCGNWFFKRFDELNFEPFVELNIRSLVKLSFEIFEELNFKNGFDMILNHF